MVMFPPSSSSLSPSFFSSFPSPSIFSIPSHPPPLQTRLTQAPPRKRIIIRNTLYGHVGFHDYQSEEGVVKVSGIERAESKWTNERDALTVMPTVEVEEVQRRGLFGGLGKGGVVRLQNTEYEIQEDCLWEIPRNK